MVTFFPIVLLNAFNEMLDRDVMGNTNGHVLSDRVVERVQQNARSRRVAHNNMLDRVASV